MSLHNEIMNIKCDPEQPTHDKSYREGHRDARHAAAELALKADTEVERRVRLGDTMEQYKYIVIKKNHDNVFYEVYLHNDTELAEHIRGTFDYTDHTIISVTNIRA